MRVFGSLPDLMVSPGQQQGIGITDLCLDEAEIACRIEETGIPAFPVRQQFLDLIAKTHGSTVAEAAPRDNDVDLNSSAAAGSGFFQNFDQHYARRKRHSAHDDDLQLWQVLHR